MRSGQSAAMMLAVRAPQSKPATVAFLIFSASISAMMSEAMAACCPLRGVSAAIGNDHAVTGRREDRGHLHEAVDVVGPAVEEDHDGTLAVAVLGVADVEDAGLDLLEGMEGCRGRRGCVGCPGCACAAPGVNFVAGGASRDGAEADGSEGDAQGGGAHESPPLPIQCVRHCVVSRGLNGHGSAMAPAAIAAASTVLERFVWKPAVPAMGGAVRRY